MPVAVKDSRSDNELRVALQQNLSIVGCTCDVQEVLGMLRDAEVALRTLTTGLIALDALKLPAGVHAALQRLCPSPSKGVVNRFVRWQAHAKLIIAQSTRSEQLLAPLRRVIGSNELPRACA